MTLWTAASLGTTALLVTLFAVMSVEVSGGMRSTLRQIGANAVAFSSAEPGDEAEGRAPAWEGASRAARALGADFLRLDLTVAEVNGTPLGVVSADPAGLARMTRYWTLTGRRPREPGEILAGLRVARTFGLEPGDRVELCWVPSGERVVYRVTGVAESGDEDEDRLFLALPPARPAREIEAGKVRILPPGHPAVASATPGGSADCRTCHEEVPPAMGAPVAPVRPPGGRESAGTTALPDAAFTYALLSVPGGREGIRDLEKVLDREGAGVTVRPLTRILQGEENVLARVNLLSGLAAAVVALTSAIGVGSFMLARARARRTEFALMQALGSRRRHVAALLATEAAVVALLASILGFLAGSGLASSLVRSLFGVGVGLRPSALLASIGLTLLASLIAAALGVRRALRFDPATALGGE